ncbi:hypothetical protein FRC02_010675 [Tulasnella sp. 418]|nr:hypothetical protein FRC02_010675 [Tulasnella sp. 418]
MSHPSEIPRFTGEENPEEAEKWLGILISSTGSFTESGIFRLLRNKFPVGSISRTWFNGLQATATTSWNDFELEFYDQWIATKEQKEWEAFTHHILSEDHVLGKSTAVEIAHESIRLWVHDHLQLGKSIGREDRVLIDATNKLLPPFIKAYLQAFVKSKPQSFETLCNEIKGVTQQILEYEEIRRSLSATEWSSVVERHVQQISEKVDKFIKANDDHRPTKSASSPRDQSNVDNSSSAESLNWGMSSPLTSVLSEGVAPTILGLSTPVVQSARLSHPEDEPNALYRIPQEWRKPMCLKRRDEIVIIAQRAIDFIENFRKPFTVKHCQKWNFLSAIAIRDTLIDSRRYVDTAPISGSDSDGVYDDLMLTISRVYRYYAY